MPSTILIVDDEESIRLNLSRYFRVNGYNALTAEDGRGAIEICKSTPIDVVLLDLRLPDSSGIDILKQIKELSPSTAVIIITAYGDVETAVTAMKMKAENFVLKPVDLYSLRVIVDRCIENYRNQAEIQYLKKKVLKLEGVGSIDSLRQPPEVYHAIQLLAENPSTNVLILGETGTGKGMIARIIHDSSIRNTKAFVDINCAGLSGELLESELFGHEQGAFTDAKSRKRGLLEVADGGTIFLDEVGEMSLSVQAKLLKVLEQRSFRRVGGTQNIEIDVRLITATNSNLEKASKEGRFRQDLYYRLNVIPIVLPPLRERRSDILPLAKIFLDEFNKQFQKKIRGFSSEAESMLMYYSWPGNIRELKNVIERAVLLSVDESIIPADLPDNFRSRVYTAKASSNEKEDWAIESIEKKHIETVLSACDNNHTKAAAMLNIHRTTLIKKIKKYGIAG